jgi:predicted metalloendopeptidase
VRAFRVSQNLKDWKNAVFYSNRSDIPASVRDAHAKFGIPLSMVNAFYDPTSNTITVPLGILQAPFFDLRYDDTSAYAAIGSVIGHELAHAFDPHGILFDSHGSFHVRGPWSPAGMAEYAKRTSCIASAYSTTEGLAEALLSCQQLQSSKRATYGERTLGESMADLVGTRLAYEALFGTEGGSMTEQRLAQTHAFFYTYAQMWCAVHTIADSCDRLLYDVHAVAEMRVDHTLRQLPEYFAAAFHCGPETTMYSKTPCVIL